MRRLPSTLFGTACLALATACRPTVAALGESAQAATRNADELFTAFEYRFHEVQRAPRFDATRIKMARYALIPSAIFADTSLWSAISADSSRDLFIHATHASGHYTFATAASRASPSSLGDESHWLRLESLGRNDYQWTTLVEHALGHASPASIARTIVAALTAAEGRPSQTALADARATFPRAAAHLAQLVTVDSLRAAPLPDGSTVASLGLTLHPGSFRAAYPSFAAYLDKYIVPAIYRMQLTDHQGAAYFEMTGREGHAVVQLRSRAGRLVALDSSARIMPDSLILTSDFSAKYRVFRIGYRKLASDFIVERGDHLRAWTLHFRQEPAWQFPLGLDKLIRAPLRRPFQGGGAELRLGVRDDLGPQTIGFRSARVTVNESAIMRSLGRLGTAAFVDFSGRVEAEQNRFLSLLFAALRADVAAWR